jgi:hypothetical protein
MALGELQLKPNEFWTLTNGEIMAMIRGFVVRRDLESANHRNLYTLTLNMNRKKNSSAKKPHEVWELDIDSGVVMDFDERLELYKKIAANSKFNA